MKKIYINAIQFLRMVESGVLSFGTLDFAVNFLKVCRESGAREWRIAQPERSRWLVVVVPEYAIWIDSAGSI